MRRAFAALWPLMAIAVGVLILAVICLVSHRAPRNASDSPAFAAVEDER